MTMVRATSPSPQPRAPNPADRTLPCLTCTLPCRTIPHSPALNILMKLMAIISVVFADFFLSINKGGGLISFYL